MEELAYKLHTRADDHQEDPRQEETKKSNFQITITRNELEAIFQEIIGNEQLGLSSIPSYTKPREFLAFYLGRAGLLIEPKDKHIQFSHLSFQEYLVASRIYRKQKKRGNETYLKAELFNKLSGPGWQEVAQHFYGIDTIQGGEGQSEQLQYLFDEKDRSHYVFLLNLIAHTKNRFSEDEVLRWINTLFFCMASGKIGRFGDIVSTVSTTIRHELNKKYGEPCFQKLIKLYTQLVQGVIDGKKPETKELLLFADKGDREDIAVRIRDVEQNEAMTVENALAIGLFLDDFRNISFSSLKLDLLDTPMRNLALAHILDGYVPFIKKKEQLLRIIDQKISLQQKTSLVGSVFFIYSSQLIENDLYKNALQLQLKTYLRIYPLVDKAMAKTVAVGRGLEWDMAWEMTINLAMIKDMVSNMARNVDMARHIAAYIDRDIDIERDRDAEIAIIF